MNSARRFHAIAPWLAAAAGLAFFLAAAASPGLLGVPLLGMEGTDVLVVPSPVRLSLVVAAAAALAGLAAILALRLRGDGNPLRRAAWPLALLPAALLPLPLRPWIGIVPAGHLLFLIPAACLSLSLLALADAAALQRGKGTGGKGWISVLLLSALLYTAVGSWFTRSVGAHSGDEGHYIMQAESLARDRDLDVRNNFGFTPRPDQALRLHISPNSRNGKWYSWHPFGLSALLAPLVPLGVAGRHLALAAASGAGLAATFLLARLIGAGAGTAALATGLFGTSLLWGVYSSRALPEVLGASLVALLSLAALLQQRRPGLSLLLASAAAAALPWVHNRFLAAAGIGVAWYVLEALIPNLRERQAWIRATTLALLAAAGWGAYFAVQFQLYTGGNSYGFFVKSLFDSPQGMLYVLTSTRGILPTLPQFLWFLPAAAVTLAAGRGVVRRLAAVALLQFLVVLATSCSNHVWTGGSCLPGRYLVVITPLFAAIGAPLLERIGRAARWWLCALSALSLLPFLVLLVGLPSYGNLFAYPYGVELVNSAFILLPRPFPLPGGYLHHVAILAAYAATGLLLTRFGAGRRGAILVAGLLAALALSSTATMPAARADLDGRWAARFLDDLDLDRAAVLGISPGAGRIAGVLDRHFGNPFKTDPFDDAWAHAVLLERAGLPDLAAERFGKAAAVDPSRSAPLVRMAALRRRLGETEAAGGIDARLARDFPAGRPVGGDPLFGGSIRLRGWDLSTGEAGGGREIRLSLNWECLRPVKQDYTVFVHFVRGGEIVLQGDHSPRAGTLATNRWKRGELVRDDTVVHLPGGIEPDGVSVQIGLYDKGNGGKRLRRAGGTTLIKLPLD